MGVICSPFSHSLTFTEASSVIVSAILRLLEEGPRPHLGLLEEGPRPHLGLLEEGPRPHLGLLEEGSRPHLGRMRIVVHSLS